MYRFFAGLLNYKRVASSSLFPATCVLHYLEHCLADRDAVASRNIFHRRGFSCTRGLYVQIAHGGLHARFLHAHWFKTKNNVTAFRDRITYYTNYTNNTNAINTWPESDQRQSQTSRQLYDRQFRYSGPLFVTREQVIQSYVNTVTSSYIVVVIVRGLSLGRMNVI